MPRNEKKKKKERKKRKRRQKNPQKTNKTQNPKSRNSLGPKTAHHLFVGQGFRKGKSYASNHHKRAGWTGSFCKPWAPVFPKSVLTKQKSLNLDMAMDFRITSTGFHLPAPQSSL